MRVLNATPKDVTRIGSIADAIIGGWSKVPVYYSYVLQLQLPLTEDEFNRVFARSLRLFLATQQQESCPGVQTNIDIGAGFPEPFLLLGLGILAIGEDRAFSQPGVAATEGVLDAIAGSVAIPTMSAIPCEGATSTLVTEGFVPSRFDYGGPTWRLINKFFQMKRFVLRVGRCEIVNENLFELGMIQSPPVFRGASSSEISTMPFIRETNDVMNAKELNYKFLPPNTCENSSIPAAEFGVISVSSPAPNAAVTYGHPDVRNLANRIYCLPQPLLITPFTRVDLEFQTVDNDCCLLPAARRAAMLRRETPYEGSPTLVENGLSMEAITVPGGCLSLGILLKGYVCTPQAVADYIVNYLTCGSAYEQLFVENAYVSGIVQKFQLHDTLKGLGLLRGNSIGALPGHPEMRDVP